MDHWLFDFSDCSTSPWVNSVESMGISELIDNRFFSIFVPQLATLPSDNSTTEWDHLKYLIDHFDSSSRFLERKTPTFMALSRSGRFHFILNIHIEYHRFFLPDDLYRK